MGKPAIHKWKTKTKWYAVCMSVPQLDYGTDNKKKVTCKKCLRKIKSETKGQGK